MLCSGTGKGKRSRWRGDVDGRRIPRHADLFTGRTQAFTPSLILPSIVALILLAHREAPFQASARRLHTLSQAASTTVSS